MTATVHDPHLDHRATVGVGMHRSGVRPRAVGFDPGAAERFTIGLARRQTHFRKCCRDQAFGVRDGHYRIAVAVEDDHRRARATGRGTTGQHRHHRGADVLRSAVGKPGMDTHRGVQLGIRHRHDHCHGAAGGQPRNEDPVGVDAIVTAHLPGDPGDDRWLASTGTLITGAEPVPQAVPVRLPGLLGIGDQEGVPLGEVVHPGAGSEIGRVLLAAVQHHDQRHRLSPISGRHEQVESTTAGGLCVIEVVDLARPRRLHTVRNNTSIRCRTGRLGHRPRSPGCAGERGMFAVLHVLTRRFSTPCRVALSKFRGGEQRCAWHASQSTIG